MFRAAKEKLPNGQVGAFYLGDGTQHWWAPGGHEGKLLTAPGVVDAATAKVVHSWGDVTPIPMADIRKWLGAKKLEL